MKLIILITLINILFVQSSFASSLFACNSRLKIKEDVFLIAFKVKTTNKSILKLSKNGVEIQTCNLELNKLNSSKRNQSNYIYRYWESSSCKEYAKNHFFIESSGYIKISDLPKKPSYLVINKNLNTLECFNVTGNIENLEDI